MSIFEIRFHGRGGQGAVTAANLLVGAAVLEGKWGQAIPSFGAERRGAPVVAYARISDKPVKKHSRVLNPDAVVVLDSGLIGAIDIVSGLKDGGVIIVNSPVKPRINTMNNYKVYFVDANSIARELGLVIAGWPAVNTAMLGALSRATGIVDVESIKKHIMSYFKGAIGKKNALAALNAYNNVKDP